MKQIRTHITFLFATLLTVSAGASPIESSSGFTVEKIYEAPKKDGSWVSLCRDENGRLYASDQRGAGLFRITLTDAEPVVEKVPLDVSGAQGMSWVGDRLWFNRLGSKTFALSDTNGDDVLDRIETIASMPGHGEHGNHALVLSEDKEKVFVVNGNHTPYTKLEKERIQHFNEGLLLPRQWDAKGHARGRMAPGGWVCSIDVKTMKKELISAGYRNQYDLCENEWGDLFTYDADMEYDFGLPWYRPTRINHVVSGSDFGWRSGAGKWPAYYEDSLPSVVDIGPGSPTGVISGKGSKFPAKYQRAVFAMDWTFGIIYAIHLKPEGASYTAEAEPFVSGTPLPVTDLVIGKDGAMYFLVGGRGLPTTLYKVSYVGPESTEPMIPELPGHIKQARALRNRLEAFHGEVHLAAVDSAWAHLSSSDRFIRHAARVAIESQPVEQWVERVYAEKNPQTKITAAVALARMGRPEHKSPLLKALNQLDLSHLDEGKTLGLLRAYSLCFINLGKPAEDERLELIEKLSPELPSESDDINTELIRLLVYLEDTSVITKTMRLIAERKPPVIPDWSHLVPRSPRYGRAVKRMLEKYPPSLEIGYAYMLRNLKKGWTLEQRQNYFRFLNEAAKKQGGASFPGYLTNIRKEALANCSDEDRVALNDITKENFEPQPKFPIHPPKGPGRAWTLSEASEIELTGASFENGRSLYFSAVCGACHRMNELGGGVGPGLHSIPNKFSKDYVIEAILDPSKDISDQYGSSIVTLNDGKTHSGMVVENGNNVQVYTKDPAAKPVTISTSDIKNIEESPVSQMPPGLINALNRDELRDLLAYLMAAGDPEAKIYK